MHKIETNTTDIRTLADSELNAVSGGMPNGNSNAFLGKPLPWGPGPIVDPLIPGPSLPLPVA